jgi:BASS family bile acid:Na+ symporter
MTVVNSLITVFTIPLITLLALQLFMHQDIMIELPFIGSVLDIIKLTVLPATLGILVRHYFEKLSQRLEEPLRYILPILMLLVYSGVLFLEKGEAGVSFRDFFRILPYAFSLNIIALTAGFLIPGLLRINKINKVTIAVEVGLQNSTLAIYVAGVLLNNYSIAMVAIVYGSFSFFSTWGFGYLARKYLPIKIASRV